MDFELACLEDFNGIVLKELERISISNSEERSRIQGSRPSLLHSEHA